MTEQSYAREALAWAKQRLDDLDTIIAEVEKSAENLEDSVRQEADRVVERLRASQLKLEEYEDSLRTEVATARHSVEEIQEAIDAEWVEVESAFQSFLSIAEDRAGAVRDIVAARTQAQRQSWETALRELRDQAAEAVETARGEFDAAIKRLSDEAERFQARIGEAKDAGDESWTAVKSGLAEARAVHDRTIQRIKDAFSKLL
jgi:chromosome segregation ATPase